MKVRYFGWLCSGNKCCLCQKGIVTYKRFRQACIVNTLDECGGLSLLGSYAVALGKHHPDSQRQCATSKEAWTFSSTAVWISNLAWRNPLENILKAVTILLLLFLFLLVTSLRLFTFYMLMISSSSSSSIIEIWYLLTAWAVFVQWSCQRLSAIAF